MNLRYFYTNDYGLRCLLRRIFISDSQIEKYVLLSELLNMSYKTTYKKPIETLAGANLSFSCYNFANSVCFEEKLIQTEVEGFKAYFFDPFKKAIKIFDEVVNLKFETSEKILAIAKDRVIKKYEKITSNSYWHSFSTFKILNSYPQISLPLIRSITIKDLEQAFEKLKSEKIGNYIYIGKQYKEDLFSSFKPFEKDFDNLPFNYNVKANNLDSKYTKDSKTFIVEIPEIKDYQGYLNTITILNSIKLALISNINKPGCNVDVRYQIFSRVKAVINVSVDKGKISNFTHLVVTSNNSSGLNITNFISDAIDINYLNQVKYSGSYEDLLALLKDLQALCIEFSPKIIYGEMSIDKNKINDLFNQMKVAYSIVAKNGREIDND